MLITLNSYLMARTAGKKSYQTRFVRQRALGVDRAQVEEILSDYSGRIAEIAVVQIAVVTSVLF